MRKFNSKIHQEDYALQVVPDSYRQWSWISLFSVLLGNASAMFYLAYGGDLVQMYGAKTLIIGMIISTIIIGSTGFLLALIASETGLDMDLITSGSGFGYKGAGFTALFYAISFFIFFAMEGTIISAAIHSQFPHIPMGVLYGIVGLAFIPLTWYGMTALNYIMWGTLPIYLMLLVWSVILASHVHNTIHFFSYIPAHPANKLAGAPLLQVLATSMALIATATGTADIARFIPKKKQMITTFALSYVMCAIIFLGATILGAWLGLKLRETNPGVYFPSLLGFGGVLLVAITQIRINVLNTYVGSLALTTFFSRIFNFSPGRHWWVILLAIVSTLLMFGGILNHLLQILTFQSVFLIAWAMAVISYNLFNRNIFQITADNFEFQKGKIPDYNPIGLIAISVSLLISYPMVLGLFGPMWKTLGPFCAAIISFILVPVLPAVIKSQNSKIDESIATNI